jgi:hypothetical protein
MAHLLHDSSFSLTANSRCLSDTFNSITPHEFTAYHSSGLSPLGYCSPTNSVNMPAGLTRAEARPTKLANLVIWHFAAYAMLFNILYNSGKFLWYKCRKRKTLLYILTWQIIKSSLNCLTRPQRNSPQWNVGGTYIGTLATCSTRCAYVEQPDQVVECRVRKHVHTSRFL